MADYTTIRTAGAGVRAAQIDEGLRAHMNKVYGLMSVAMVLTGGVAWAVGTNDAMIAAIFGTPVKWLVMFAPLIMVFAFSAMINRLSAAAAQLFFYTFAALMGLSISREVRTSFSEGRPSLLKKPPGIFPAAYAFS